MTPDNDATVPDGRTGTPADPNASPRIDEGIPTTPGSTTNRRAWLIAGIATAAALILVASGFTAGAIASRVLVGGRGACDAAAVADRVLPTIVTIVVDAPGGSSNGSGEIITRDGYILTNNHVISSAATSGTVAARFSDGHQLPARIVGRDPKTDLAVIKVDSEDTLPVIREGRSGSLSIGQPVVALGAPLGLYSTVTAGIVSALGRTVPVASDDDRNAILVGAIQTDASINPGNSGGALVDCRGRLVGVNTAIATVPGAGGQSSTGSVGIGFAIPQSVALPLAHQLIEHGEVSYPNIGADLIPIPHAVAVRYGVADGLYVQSVTPDGPADDAGIQAGDVVTTINGRSARSLDVLTHVQLTSQAGDVVTIEYLRNGAPHTTEVTLAD